jgi:hypothetical protein
MNRAIICVLAAIRTSIIYLTPITFEVELTLTLQLVRCCLHRAVSVIETIVSTPVNFAIQSVLRRKGGGGENDENSAK